MPHAPLPPAVSAFVAGAHPAVLASVRADGTPHSAATWYDWDAGRVLLSMDDSRLRLRFLRRNPAVSLTILDRDSWYHHVTLVGYVDEFRPDGDLVDTDRLARRYTGARYRDRESPRTSAWVRITAWHGWDAVEAIRTHVEREGAG